MTDEEKALRRERIKEKMQKLGKTITNVGFPVIGSVASIVSPQAAELVKTVGKVIGVIQGDSNVLTEPDIDRIDEVIAAKSPEVLLGMRKVEAELARAHLEFLTEQDRSTTAQISSVNETIRAEVLANPESGNWRPIWGKWSCYGFWIFIFVYAIILGYSAYVGNTEFIAQTPMILGSFSALMVLPAAILGVASYHRGVEKRILAGETREPSRFNPMDIFSAKH